ncbi:Transcriptional factor [Mycena indigotica]|uniref:General transcription and DNA repair factor IIH subunit TFB4 n=1 Tax=Mycena indigotica TaxID=2126181 RepID=A0A8H6TF10_9AGAR|nr:Transcriptional factor [Mycena indigotica]KAF7315506.1 Transcriptional factor [Mycena indigotica]
MEEETKASHLSVVVDISPSNWDLSARGAPHNTYPLTLASFLSQLLAFLNAHIACRDENTLAVFGAFPKKSVMLYASTESASDWVSTDSTGNAYPPFNALDSMVVQRISAELQLIENSMEEEAPSSLVGALTKALCYVNRISLPPNPNSKAQANGFHPGVLPDPRILILSVSPDLSTSYIPIMNSIFSAQKLKTTIDVCQVYGHDSVFLQQAAHLTGGSYIFLERRDALLQYLMASLLRAMSFLPPPSIRKTLSVPTQEQVDFRAACFCHKKIVDIGFVCSVCLSIYCQPLPVCTTCRTKFPMKTLTRLNAARPLLGNKGGSSGAVTNNGSGGNKATNLGR